jgi:hypothetical protein
MKCRNRTGTRQALTAGACRIAPGVSRAMGLAAAESAEPPQAAISQAPITFSFIHLPCPPHLPSAAQAQAEEIEQKMTQAYWAWSLILSRPLVGTKNIQGHVAPGRPLATSGQNYILIIR